jgi:hypothetical protein
MWSAPVTRVGKGRVIAGADVESALASLGQAPDFEYAADAGAQLLFVHRRLLDGDLYFVANRSGKAVSTEARFHVRAKAAELWHADSGRTEPTSYRSEGGAAARKLAAPEWSPVATLDSGWSVRFDGLAAPVAIENGSLGSLTGSSDPQVKYFSGTSIYRNSFTLPAGARPGMPLQLDLGQVGDVAEVLVNGKPAGIAWKPPYRVDIGALVVVGANTVEVRVANLWVNRLVGDAQPGAAKVTFTAAPTYKADAPLRPSGLIGPVTLRAGANRTRIFQKETT